MSASDGGWNDHVYLVWYTHAQRMLSSYRDLHTPHVYSTGGTTCRLPAEGGLLGRLTRHRRWLATAQGRGSEPIADLLSCATSEQWRERVGRLWAIPYVEHPPEALPMTGGDAVQDQDSRDQFSFVEGDDPSLIGCFPALYALAKSERCVPKGDAAMVLSGAPQELRLHADRRVRCPTRVNPLLPWHDATFHIQR